MTISIFIILSVIAAAGFWLYFKKNRSKIEESKKEKTIQRKKRDFNDLDKMLSHVKTNKVDDIIEKIPENHNENDKKDKSDQSVKNNDSFDINEKILGSIILEKRKKK